MSRINELYDGYHENTSNMEFLHFLKDPRNLNAINDVNPEQQTVLHYAAYYEDANIVKMLLERHADIRIKDKYDRSALSYCIDSSADVDLTTLRLLISAGADINEEDSRGFTSLHYAVIAGNLIKIKKLLAMGADIHKMNVELMTPMRIALVDDIANKAEILKLFFKHAVIVSEDVTNARIPPGLTDGIIVIGSTIWPESELKPHPVSRIIKGFERAITTVEEFNLAVNAGIKFDYNALELKTRNNNNPQNMELRQKVLLLNKIPNKQGSDVKRSLARGLATLLASAKNEERTKLIAKIQTMPPDIRNLIDEEMNTLAMSKSNNDRK